MKMLLFLVVVLAVWGGWALWHTTRPVVPPPVKVPEIGGAVLPPKNRDVAKGAPLETPDLQAREIYNVGVNLEALTSSEVMASLGTAASSGDSVVRPSPFGNAVVVSGTNWQNVFAVSETVRLLDRPNVQMVMVQAVVLRTSKGKSSAVGVWGTLQEVVAAGGFGLGHLSFDTVSGVFTLGSVTAAQELVRLLGSNDVSRYGFKVESRPLLAAASGQEAWFTSGREIPVSTTTQAVANSQTSVTFKKVQFSFGVKPAVLPSGRVALAITQTNDDIVGSTVINGNSVPTLATQSLTTRIELAEGQVAILGGMQVVNAGDSSSGFPGLGAVPPLSWVFGNRKKTDEKAELVVAVTVFRVPNGSNPMPVRRAEPVQQISQNGKPTRNGIPQNKKQQKKVK